MGITRNRPNRPRRNKNLMINQPELNNPIYITEASASGTVLTLTFDQVVSLVRGKVPTFLTDVATAEPLSATQPNPNQIAVMYSEDISAATELTIPHRDPAIRSGSGGFVTANTFPLAA